MELTYLLIFIIFYYMVSSLKNKFFPQDLSPSPSENFLSKNIFLKNYKKYDDYNILAIKESQQNIPILLTDFKFSEAFKLGFELSKIYPIKFIEAKYL